jgi:hypothetical protein
MYIHLTRLSAEKNITTTNHNPHPTNFFTLIEGFPEIPIFVIFSIIQLFHLNHHKKITPEYFMANIAGVAVLTSVIYDQDSNFLNGNFESTILRYLSKNLFPFVVFVFCYGKICGLALVVRNEGVGVLRYGIL